MGRPREFDLGEALEAALRVFWSKGYEGTSYIDLTKACGVEKPALYSAFGNKEALFKRVVSVYIEQYQSFMSDALDLPAIRDVIAHPIRVYRAEHSLPRTLWMLGNQRRHGRYR